MKPVLINGMFGLGDNIYQRAFVKAFGRPVYISTPWPEIYRGIPEVHFIKPDTNLRTQKKNIERQPAGFWIKPRPMPSRRIRYGASELAKGSIIAAMQRRFRIEPEEFDLPQFMGPEISGQYAVVRPVTVRREWRNEARNPLPEYVIKAAEILRDRGFIVVSVADLQDGEEWTEGPPAHDIAYHRGELNVEQLLGLVQGASVVVGGVGWIVPACIASGVPLVTILGGQGGHNAPEKTTDPDRMDLSKTRWIYPDNYCRCAKMLHQCDKTITGFADKFQEALCSVL